MFVKEKKQGEAKTVDLTRQVFLTAADYMEKNGWCQKKEKDSEGRVCLWGALSYGNNMYLRGEFLKEIERLLEAEADSERRWGTVWNDAPGRTKEEVVTLLRKIGNS